MNTKFELLKADLITNIASCTDSDLISRVADFFNRRGVAPSKTPEVETRLITQREAARRLGLSPTTIWRLGKSGDLNFVSVRGKYRVSLASVLHYAGVA